MKLSNENLLRFLGFNTQGDLGPWTFYTSKRKGLVWFLKAPPKEPPSFLQTHQRNLFRLVGLLWMAFPIQHRNNWLDAAEAAHLGVHGYNIFTYCAITHDTGFVPALERILGKPLRLP